MSSKTMQASFEHRIGDIVQLPGGVTSVNHIFHLPLNWDQSEDSDTIEVVARELFNTQISRTSQLPYLLYLQGGPGYPSPRYTGSGDWISYALKLYRVILLDQRGTGRSTAVTSASLQKIGDPELQARYLSHFRADSIVRDCEEIRKKLESLNESDRDEVEIKWTILGQSYGGFCLTTYLSMFPESVEFGLFTGGIPPLRSIDDVYRATFRRCAERNRKFYGRYPDDISKVRKIVKYLDDCGGAELPTGGLLSPQRFLQLGIILGQKAGSEMLHYLLEEAWEDETLSYAFLRSVENMSGFETNPIYALLHESIYMYGKNSTSKSNWSASRMLDEIKGENEFIFFDWKRMLSEQNDSSIYFTGEMIFPWMFEGDYKLLEPLKEVAHALAKKSDWGELYSAGNLSKANVSCAGIVYYDDMYVEREFSEELSRLLPDCKIWVTNEYQHSGLRDDGVKIFKTLLGMIRDDAGIPS